jgi:hypothetical protein
MEWVFRMSSLKAEWVFGCKRIMLKIIEVVSDIARKLQEQKLTLRLLTIQRQMRMLA